MPSVSRVCACHGFWMSRIFGLIRNIECCSHWSIDSLFTISCSNSKTVVQIWCVKIFEDPPLALVVLHAKLSICAFYVLTCPHMSSYVLTCPHMSAHGALAHSQVLHGSPLFFPVILCFSFHSRRLPLVVFFLKQFQPRAQGIPVQDCLRCPSAHSLAWLCLVCCCWLREVRFVAIRFGAHAIW